MQDDFQVRAEAGLEVLHPHHDVLAVKESVADEFAFAHAVAAKMRDQDVAVMLLHVELRVGRHDGGRFVVPMKKDHDVARFFFLGREIVGIELDAVKSGHLPVQNVHAVAVEPVLASSVDRILVDRQWGFVVRRTRSGAAEDTVRRPERS